MINVAHRQSVLSATTAMIGKQVTYTDASGAAAHGVVTAASLFSGGATVQIGDITVQDNKVTVKINDVIVLEYTEPPGAQPGQSFTRKLAEGTFALQAHDPKSVVHYRNIRVKRLD